MQDVLGVDMKIIAHRANLNGPNPNTENHPEQIDKCITRGYDVEIDLRYYQSTNTFWLGHDKSEHVITLEWLNERKQNLWIHCKDLESFNVMCSQVDDYNFFWHQEDDYTLTSKKYIWAYPGKPYTLNTVIVMPEWNISDLSSLQDVECYGICTDYPEKLK